MLICFDESSNICSNCLQLVTLIMKSDSEVLV